MSPTQAYLVRMGALPENLVLPEGFPFSTQWRGYIWDKTSPFYERPIDALRDFKQRAKEIPIDYETYWPGLLYLCLNNQTRAFIDVRLRTTTSAESKWAILCSAFANGLGNSPKEIEKKAFKLYYSIAYDEVNSLEQYNQLYLFYYNNADMANFCFVVDHVSVYLKALPQEYRQTLENLIGDEKISVFHLIKQTRSWLPEPAITPQMRINALLLEEEEEEEEEEEGPLVCRYHTQSTSHSTRDCRVYNNREEEEEEEEEEEDEESLVCRYHTQSTSHSTRDCRVYNRIRWF